MSKRTLIRTQVAVLSVALFLLGVLSVTALAQSAEEVEAVVGAITGSLAIAGLGLSALVVMAVGLIRRYTGLDGPRVKLVVLVVSVVAVSLYYVIEGGMALGAAIPTALAVFVAAIGEHEVVGKWVRNLITGTLGEPSGS